MGMRLENPGAALRDSRTRHRFHVEEVPFGMPFGSVTFHQAALSFLRPYVANVHLVSRGAIRRNILTEHRMQLSWIEGPRRPSRRGLHRPVRAGRPRPQRHLQRV